MMVDVSSGFPEWDILLMLDPFEKYPAFRDIVTPIGLLSLTKYREGITDGFGT
jgi:hypothetical protein